jgi:hypothetical protein
LRLELLAWTAQAIGDALHLPLDGAGAAKHLPVQLGDIVA